ncbi:hypothetical protein IHV10_13115 [Fictibacillus sp. 5RED26]|uniref:5-methylcytosine restriction system specificity protein McrC n=1 Tax=Fictibacillus sp. 5RED26 TaxID=2745876 RepID=UPI0018CD8F61|nr:hypothetical protein [Fictibacillus sp. 5RED26]MBH0157313.1 hypothetical protein [Fictibacillus sp. 5RED26]
MSETKYKVPIYNLFCILSYTYDIPDLIKSLGNEDDDLPQFHLLVHLFLKESNNLISKGLSKDYHLYGEETNQLSGKILFEDSINNIIQRKPLLSCEKDKFDEDTLVNQILKATLYSLIKLENITKVHKTKIYSYLHNLQQISNKKLERQDFYRLSPSRTKHHYKHMLLLARLIFELKNLSDEDRLIDFINILNDERKMQVIFEKFVLNFYHYEQKHFIPKAERIKWKMIGGNLTIIPEMKTDVSLINRFHKQKIIIEVKYYSEIFTKSFNINKIRSTHLYQLFAYLNHSPENYVVQGIILYPTNGDQLDELYIVPTQVGHEIKDTNIRIYTIDLNQRWSKIHEQLLVLLKLD